MNILNKLSAKGRMFAALLLGAVALVSGCKEIDPSAISLSERMFRLGVEAQELELRVMSNTDWKAEITPASADYEAGGWLLLSRAEGRGSANLTLYIEPYAEDLAKGRQAILKFTTKDGGAMASVIINQSHQNNTLKIMPEELEIGSAAQSVNFMVLSNTEWTISGACPWARITSPTASTNEGDGMVTIAVDEFASHGETRSYGFHITAGTSTERVDVMFNLTQRGQPDPTLILGQENLYFDAIVTTGTTDNISVPFLTNVDQGNVFAAPNQPWIKAEIVDNSGVQSVKVTVTSNDQSINARTGVVYVTAHVDNEPVTKQITVTQAGSVAPNFDLVRNVITIDDKTLGATPEDVKFDFAYIPHGDVSVKLAADFDPWITATLDETNKKVSVTAQPNYTNDTRTTAITLYAQGGGTTVSKSLTVIQRAAGNFNLKITPSTANVGIAGETITYYVVSDLAGVDFVASSDKPWVTPQSMTNAAQDFDGTAKKFTAEVVANDAVLGRTATITVIATYGMKSDHIVLNITQDGTGAPQAVIARNAVTAPQAGADYSIGVGNSEGTTITCTSTVPWIVTKGAQAGSPSFNSTAKTIDFSVVKNDQTHAERTGIIDVIVEKGGATQFLSIAVTQLGMGSAELVISQTDITVEATTTEVVIPIHSQNGTWSVLGTSAVDQALFNGTPTKVAGSGSLDDLKILLNANTTTTARTGNVGLLATNGDSSVTYIINVTQKGLEPPTITPMATEIRVPATATAQGSPVTVPLLDWDSSIDLTTALYLAPADMFDGTLTKVTTNASSATLEIGVTANTALAERTGVITITAKRGGLTALYKVTVIQAGADAPTLLFPDYTYSYGPGALTDLSVLFDNINGATITAVAYPDWLDAAPVIGANNDTVTFGITENAGDETRTGIIVLKAVLGDNFAYYNVALSQAGQASLGATLSAANITIDWDVTGAIADPVVYVNNLPTATTPATDVTALSSAGWLTVTTPISVTNGTGTLALSTTAANPKVTDRTAVVQLLVKQGTQVQPLTLTVTQQGAPAPTAYLATDQLKVAATSVAGTVFSIPFLNVNDNVTFGAATYDDFGQTWVSTAMNNSNLEVTIESDNTAADARTLEVTIPVTAAGQTIPAKLTVTQYGLGEPVLNLGTTSLLIGSKGQTGVSVYFENPNAAAVSVESWPAHVTDNGSDLNTGLLKFDVVAATDSETRAGDIILKAIQGGKTAYYQVNVAQNGLAALNPSMSIASIVAGDAVNSISEVIQVLGIPTSGVTASFTVNQNWLNGGVGATLASPDYELNPGIDANTTGATRYGTILFKVVRDTNPDEVVYLTVAITQLAAEPPAAPEVYFDRTDVAPFALAGGNNATAATLNGYDANYTYQWTVPSWISGQTLGAGGALSLSAADNTGGSEREGVITLVVKNGASPATTLTLKVAQLGVASVAVPYFPQASLNIGNAAVTDQILSIEAWANGYTATVLSNSDWLTITDVNNLAANGTFKYSATANTGVTRTGVITANVTYAGKTAALTLSITQAGADAPVMPALPQAGVSISHLPIAAPVAVQLAPWDSSYTYSAVSSTPDWLTVTTTQAGAFTYTVDENTGAARTGKITVTVTTSAGAVLTALVYTVEQAAAAAIPALTLNLAQSSLEFAYDADGAGAAVAVATLEGAVTDVVYSATPSNGNFTVTCDATTGAVTVTPAANTKTVALTTEVKVVATRAATSEIVTATFTVTQAAAPASLDLLADPTGIVLGQASGTTADVNLINWTSNYTVQAQRSANWIDVVTVSGTTGVVTIKTANANAAAGARVGTVTLAITKPDGTTQSLVIGVMQEGTVPAVIPYPIGGISAGSGVTFAPTAASDTAAQEITIYGFDKTYHDFVSANVPSWLTVEPPQSPMKVYPNSANTGSAARTANVDITILAKGTQTVLAQFTIPVTQEGTSAARPEIVFTPASFTAAAAGEDASIAVSNPEGVALTPSTDHSTWITSVAYNQTTGLLTFTVQPNVVTSSRSGNVILSTATGYTYTFPVSQDGVPNEPRPVTLAQLSSSQSAPLGGAGSTIDFVLTLVGNSTLQSISPAANGSDKLQSPGDWFTIAPTNPAPAGLAAGQTSYTVTVTDANSSYTAERSADVVITVASPEVPAGLALNYTVIQAPAPLQTMTGLSFVPYMNAFKADGTAYDVATTGEVTLTNSLGIPFTGVTSQIYDNATWFTIQDEFNAAVDATVYKATIGGLATDYAGNGQFTSVHVTFSADGYEDYTAVFQVGQYAPITNTSFGVQSQYDFAAAADTYTFTVTGLTGGFEVTQASLALRALGTDMNGNIVFWSAPTAAAKVGTEQTISVTATSNTGSVYSRANLLTFNITDGTDTYTYHVILNQNGAPQAGAVAGAPTVAEVLDLNSITGGYIPTQGQGNGRIRPNSSGGTVTIPLTLPAGVTASENTQTGGGTIYTSVNIAGGNLEIDFRAYQQGVNNNGRTGNGTITLNLSNGETVTVLTYNPN